jgi:hypothetical protein
MRACSLPSGMCDTPLSLRGRGWREAPGEGAGIPHPVLRTTFSPREKEWSASTRSQPTFVKGSNWSPQLTTRPASRPVSQPISGAPPRQTSLAGAARANRGRDRGSGARADVVGQKHEAERKHPEAENRQDGEAPTDDQQYPGRDPRPARGGLPQPPGNRRCKRCHRNKSWSAGASARDRQPCRVPQSVVFPMPRPARAR